MWHLLLLSSLFAGYGSLGIEGKEHSNIILRPNIGIILNQIGSKHFMPTYWHHTIAIPIATVDKIPRSMLPCKSKGGRKRNKCTNFPVLWQHIMKDSHSLMNQLLSDIAENEQIIKDVIKLEINRQKRGWFDGLGNLAKKIMGVATEHDVQTLANHVLELENMIQSKEHNRKIILEGMHSYEVATNNRLATIHKQIGSLEILTSELANVSQNMMSFYVGNNSIPVQINKLSESLQTNDRMTKIAQSINLHLETLQAMKVSTQNLISDLNLLVDGKLSPNLVKPALLKSILGSVKDNMNKIAPSFSIVSSVKSYYSENNWVTSTYVNSHLFVKLKIKISSPENKLDIFKIDSYPMPLSDQDASVYTKLTGFSKFLAISKDKQRYLEFSEFDKSTQNFGYIPKLKSNTSCAISIYDGIDEDIINNCRKIIGQLNTSSVQDVVYKTSNSEFIIISNDEWTVTCNDSSRKIVKHRSMFKIQVECNCFVTNGDVSLFPDMATCISPGNTVVYSSNALAYFGLYKNLVNINLTSSNFHAEPFSFELPKFEEITRNLEKLDITDLSQAHEMHDLETAFNKTLYTENPNTLWTLHWWTSKGPFITAPAISIGLITDIFEIVAICWITYKLRGLEQRVILGLSMLPLTEALDLTLPVTTQATSQVNFHDTGNFWKSILLILSLILASYSIIQQWIDRCTKSGNCICKSPVVLEKLKSELYVCLYGDHEYAYVHIKTIPTRLVDIIVHKTGNINDVYLKFTCCGPKFAIDWSLIKLGMAGTRRIHLPNQTRIPLHSFLKLRRLIRNYHTATVVVISGDDHKIICSTKVSPTQSSWEYPIPSDRKNRRSESPPDTHTQLVVSDPVAGPSETTECFNDNESDII